MSVQRTVVTHDMAKLPKFKSYINVTVDICGDSYVTDKGRATLVIWLLALQSFYSKDPGFDPVWI